MPARSAPAADQPVPPRGLVLTAAVSAALALGVAFWPAFAGKVFVYADLGMFHLPARMFYAASRSALWLPNLFCGFYLHGEGQVGMYHPFHRLTYGLLPLGLAFDLECAFAYPLALVGAGLFLRRLELPAAAAAFGATTFAFSGWMLARMTHVNTVTIIAHVPWLLWAADVVLRDPPGAKRDRALAGIALLRASQLLLGYPSIVYLSALCEAAYVVPLAVGLRSARGLAWLAGANVLGTALGAVQLLPTIEHFAASVRTDKPLAYRTALSLHPWNLLQPWAPYLFPERAFQVGVPNPIEQVFYLGAVVPVAATWVAVRRRELGRHRALVLGALSTSVVGFLLALGRYGPVYRLVADIPVLGQVRVPSRYALLVFASGAVVAAVAYADLLHVAAAGDPSARRQARWIWLASAPSVLAALAVLALEPLLRGNVGSESSVVLGAVLSLGAAGLWFAAAHGIRPALGALVVLAIAEQTAYGASLWWSAPPVTVSQYVAAIGRPPVEPPHRLLDHSAVMVNRNARGQVVYSSTTPLIVRGTRLVYGYAGLMPSRRLDYRKPAAARVAGASAALGRGAIVPLSGALDRFRFVERVLVSDAAAAAIERIDVATTAVVDAPLDLEAGPPGTIEARRDDPGDILLVTRSAARQLLVIAESYHPGWRLTVDGVARDLVRAYGDFMGAVVDAGAHEVALRFEPASLRRGRAVSGLALVLLIALLGLSRLARR